MSDTTNTKSNEISKDAAEEIYCTAIMSDVRYGSFGGFVNKYKGYDWEKADPHGTHFTEGEPEKWRGSACKRLFS